VLRKPSYNLYQTNHHMFHCLKTVFKNEGFISLYRGALPNLLLIVPEKTIKLSVNDFMRRQLSPDGKTISLRNQLIAAATAGSCQVIITSPMEIMKIYGQDAGRIHAVTGSVVDSKSPAQVVLQRFGFRGFYKGTAATLLRDIPFSMIYFPLFALLNKLSANKDKDGHEMRSPFIYTMLAATVSGAVAAAAVNPADVIKTRLQSIHQGTRKYNGIIDCFKKIYKEEGLRAFLRGAQARAIAIAPLFGIAQSVYCIGIGERILGLPYGNQL